jgi:hypothetical protein
MTMKFGLMYEIQIPEPHHDGIEHERYKQVMARPSWPMRSASSTSGP